MLKLIRVIKKALAPRKSEQEQRRAHNREQVKLIRQGIDEWAE